MTIPQPSSLRGRERTHHFIRSSPRKRGSIRRDLSIGCGVWVPAFAGTTNSDRTTTRPRPVNIRRDGFAATIQTDPPVLDRARGFDSGYRSPARHHRRGRARIAERPESQSDRSGPARILHILAGSHHDRLGTDRSDRALPKKRRQNSDVIPAQAGLRARGDDSVRWMADATPLSQPAPCPSLRRAVLPVAPRCARRNRQTPYARGPS